MVGGVRLCRPKSKECLTSPDPALQGRSTPTIGRCAAAGSRTHGYRTGSSSLGCCRRAPSSLASCSERVLKLRHRGGGGGRRLSRGSYPLRRRETCGVRRRLSLGPDGMPARGSRRLLPGHRTATSEAPNRLTGCRSRGHRKRCTHRSPPPSWLPVIRDGHRGFRRGRKRPSRHGPYHGRSPWISAAVSHLLRMDQGAVVKRRRLSRRVSIRWWAASGCAVRSQRSA